MTDKQFGGNDQKGERFLHIKSDASLTAFPILEHRHKTKITQFV